MTIRLLCKYGKYPANAIVTLDAGTEAGLVLAKQASTNTAGGTPYVPPLESAQAWAVLSRRAGSGDFMGLVDASGVEVAVGGGPVGPMGFNRAIQTMGMVFVRPANNLFYEGDLYSGPSNNLTSHDSQSCYLACVDASGIRILFSNIGLSQGSTPEQFPMNDLLLSSGAELAPLRGSTRFTRRIQFDGQDTYVLKGGRPSYKWCDPIPLTVLALSRIYIKCRLTHTDGSSPITIPRNSVSDYAGSRGMGGEGLIEGTTASPKPDATLLTAANAAWGARAGNRQYRPLAVVASSCAPTDPVVIIGDSIAAQGDSWINRLMHATNTPFINLARAGEQPSDWPGNALLRSEVCLLGKKAVYCLGRNGVGTGFAACFAEIKLGIRLLRAAGVEKITLAGIMPHTSGNGATVEGQNPEVGTTRIDLNIAFRALVGQPDGPDEFLDLEPIVTAPGDLTRWDAGLTTDLLHPIDAGIVRIVNAAMIANWIKKILG